MRPRVEEDARTDRVAAWLRPITDSEIRAGAADPH
jgi:hypothetical protein